MRGSSSLSVSFATMIAGLLAALGRIWWGKGGCYVAIRPHCLETGYSYGVMAPSSVVLREVFATPRLVSCQNVVVTEGVDIVAAGSTNWAMSL